MVNSTMSSYVSVVIFLAVFGIVIFHFVVFNHLIVVLEGIDLVNVTPNFIHSLYWFLLSAWVIGWFGARIHPMLIDK